MVQLDAHWKDGDIVISDGSFGHLLACLDNQKYIHEINADALDCDYKKVQADNQACIDDFNKQCRNLWLQEAVHKNEIID